LDFGGIWPLQNFSITTSQPVECQEIAQKTGFFSLNRPENRLAGAFTFAVHASVFDSRCAWR
jgi:hypothetical protein